MNPDCEMLQASLSYSICAEPFLALTALLLFHKTKAPYSAAQGKKAKKLEISQLPRGTSGS